MNTSKINNSEKILVQKKNALGIAVDTGPERKACRRINEKPGRFGGLSAGCGNAQTIRFIPAMNYEP